MSLSAKGLTILPSRENLFMWENISSARWDLSRVQVRSYLARKMSSRVNSCDILCGKLHEASLGGAIFWRKWKMPGKISPHVQALKEACLTKSSYCKEAFKFVLLLCRQ